MNLRFFKNVPRRSVLGMLSIISCLALRPAYAQSSDVDSNSEDDSLEEIVVTGTHIRRSGFDERQPVQVINRSDIVDQAAADLLDLAIYLPVNMGSVTNQEFGTLIGTSQFNLRGLGAGSTLVLINGRRAGKAATSDEAGNLFFDINQLPLSMFSRLDVQTDGASVTYGSEAVGGVVNMISRKGFEGIELEAKIGSSSNEEWSVSLASGIANDRGSANLYASYYQQTQNIRSDMDFIEERLNGNGNPLDGTFLSSTGQPGTYQLAQLDADGNYLGATGALHPDPDCLEAGGFLRGGRCRYTFMDQAVAVPEERRLAAFAELEYYLTDSFKTYVELSYSKNDVERTTGPGLYRNGLAAGNILIPGDHPFNFWVSDGADSITYIGPDNWDNNIHVGVPLNCFCRPLGAEQNAYKSLNHRLTTYSYGRALAGFQYDFANDWYLDISFVTNRSEMLRDNPYKYISSVLNQLITDGDINLFGTRVTQPDLISPKDGITVSGFDRNLFESWEYSELRRAMVKQDVYDAVVAGDWLDLPGGPVGWALGAQYRREDFTQTTDALTTSGQGSNGNTAAHRKFGEQRVTAFFAETLLPITESIEVSLAARQEDYGSAGKTTDPKLAGRWEVNDSISLRGSFGTSFQVPSVVQSGTSAAAVFINDPASAAPNGDIVCVDTGVSQSITFIVEGSDDLSPQTAKNMNLGFVFGSDAFRFSADYWRYDYEDLIRAGGSAQSILDKDCADDGIPNDPNVVRDPTGGQVRFVTSSFINTGNVETDGIDFQAAYTFGESRAGQFDLLFDATYVNAFDITSDDGTVVHGAGSRNFNTPFTSMPEWKGNVRLGWQSNQHSASAAVRYISSYHNDQADNTIESWTSVDARYTYSFEKLNLMDLSVGVKNMFDSQPPSLGINSRPGYDDRVHQIQGRLAYAEFIVGF